MAEKRTIRTRAVQYEGLFNVRDFYKLIADWALEKGYGRNEMMHSEQVSESGKNIHMVLELPKKVSDYAKNVIKVEINMADVKEVVIKKKDKSQTLNQGSVNVAITALFVTDYENRWQQSPTKVFFRTLVDKFIMKTPLSEARQILIDELNHLAGQIEGFLNLYRYADEK
ncbi:hypothetical protein KY311_03680 [Candidatus Woesearchaeota archaeon]|nr:hypothetical protein [Candidatus Woesearchaeota archaeon]